MRTSKIREPMELRTKRLLLRPYTEKDIPALVELLNMREIAANTLRIPHPYTDADARAFLSARDSSAAKCGMFSLETGKLVGGIGLVVEEQHHRAELGYWVGVPYWSRGYATEAALEMLRYGFQDLRLNRIYAGVYGGNKASEKVLRKIGMRHEGTLRQHFFKWEKFLDNECYGILAGDWRAQHL
jgi:ribosomal-protein-alanine N-acetyltransferase